MVEGIIYRYRCGISVDSAIARANQHATNIPRHTGASSNYTKPGSEPPDHALGSPRGGLSTKIHELVAGRAPPGGPVRPRPRSA